MKFSPVVLVALASMAVANPVPEAGTVQDHTVANLRKYDYTEFCRTFVHACGQICFAKGPNIHKNRCYEYDGSHKAKVLCLCGTAKSFTDDTKPALEQVPFVHQGTKTTTQNGPTVTVTNGGGGGGGTTTNGGGGGGITLPTTLPTIETVTVSGPNGDLITTVLSAVGGIFPTTIDNVITSDVGGVVQTLTSVVGVVIGTLLP